MYNLLVSADDKSWDGQPFFLEDGRCLEYTDAEIVKKYGDLTRARIDEIRRFPCIFAYESQCFKDPRFGLIRDIIQRQGKAKIEYEIVQLERFLGHKELSEMSFDLDTSDWELNRTHWAIKDVNLAKELAARAILLPRWARNDAKAVDITKHMFEVALSFPGETRDFVRPIAEELERLIGPNSYFYDDNYQSQLARPSLDKVLQDVYLKRSKLVVVFLCERYEQKKWCRIEFKAIKDIIVNKQDERVMYIRMDDGEVEGVFKTDGYIDGRKHTPAEVASFIQERVSLLD